MEPIFMILFAVVFLFQIALFVLLIRVKRHGDVRYKAVFDYLEWMFQDHDARFETVVKECDDRMYNLINAFGKDIDAKMGAQDKSTVDILNTFRAEMSEQENRLKEKLSEQEDQFNERLDEIALDFTQAQEAASKINDFGYSLASIFDYDPIKSLQKNRKKEAH